MPIAGASFRWGAGVLRRFSLSGERATQFFWQFVRVFWQRSRQVQAAYCLLLVSAVLLGIGLFTGQPGATLCSAAGGLFGVGRLVLRKRQQVEPSAPKAH